ncbi:MAG: hypothetical protein AWU59_1400 [Methanolobus sp. T82-4]|nr:MAG: hypothetical protein AWU59_1400 [Methanolobus sp. T82-4]
MRMWDVDPELLCRNHLLGEHLEMHMFVGAIRNNKPIAGYLDGGLVDLDRIVERHDKLAQEMQKRGYKHKSEISEEDAEMVKQYSDNAEYSGRIDVDRSVRDLLERCDECAIRIRATINESKTSKGR